MTRTKTMLYKPADVLLTIPDTIPEGRIIVHNHIRPTTRLGSRGFRAWLAKPAPEYVVCKCDWAPRLPVHYQMKKWDAS